MTTLSQQLRALATPQLLDKKPAAFDNETVYSIGVTGLEELTILDQRFSCYEPLFNVASITVEPSLLPREEKSKIDSKIDGFLVRLSPYLGLSCANKALEWLIHRYGIHRHNTDSLIKCFLPHHERDLFPKTLQLIELKSAQNKKWAWLLPVQKNGIHLSRTTLVNHCRADPAFLTIIVDIVTASLKEFDKDSKNRRERLHVLMNFYGLTLIGLVQSGPVTERILSIILPVLCRGLKSDLTDYKAASSTILSYLLRKTTMKTSLLETFMNGICKHLKSNLKESVSTVLLIFQTQNVEKLTKKSFKRLVQWSVLPSVLAALSAQFETDRLVSALFERLVPAAVKSAVLGAASGTSSSYSTDDESETAPPRLMTVLLDIMVHVTLETKTRTLAASLLLENFIQHYSDDDVDQDEMIGQMKELVRIFETRYPESLHAAIDKVMSTAEDKEKDIIETFLNIAVSSVHHRLAPNSHTTLALSLVHHRTSVRVNAVKYLLDSLESIDDKDSVKDSFLARLQDDSPEVVRILLKNPQKLWSVFTDKSELTSGLLAKLKVIDTSVSKMDLVMEVLGVLAQSEATPTLEVVVMSYLILPSSKLHALQLVTNLLSSPMAASSSLLAHLSKVWLPKVKKALSGSKGTEVEVDVSPLNEALSDCLAEAATHQNRPDLIEKMHLEMKAIPVLRQKCLTFLLSETNLKMATKMKKKEVICKLHLHFIQMVKDFMFGKKLWSLHAAKSSLTEHTISHEVMRCLCNNGHLPAVWWTDLLNRWIASLSVPDQLKEVEFWHETAADSEMGQWLQTMVMATEVVLQLNTSKTKADTIDAHLDGLRKVFGSEELYLRFMCMLCAGDYSQSLGVTAAICDKALKQMQTHLTAMCEADATAVMQSAAPVLPCLLALCVSEEGTIRHSALSMLWMLGEKCSGSSALYRPVLDLIMHYKQEIMADNSYLVSALTGLKTKTNRRKSKQTDALSTLLKVTESSNTPAFLQRALLHALSGTDSMDSLTPLLPLLARLLEQESLSKDEVQVVHLLLARYTVAVASALACDSLPLQLLTKAIKKQNLKEASVQQVAISQVNKKFFAALPDLEVQRSVAGALLDALQAASDTEVAAIIRKVFKHISLPVDLLSAELAPILQNVASTVREAKRMRRDDAEKEKKPTFETAAWIRATALLEILQTKKKVPGAVKLIPVCFQMLAKVLEVEDAGEGEYLKQLILGVIQNLCKRCSDTEPIKGNDLNLEAIVRCIRTSTNPHTHQHALLVLSVAAHIAPEQLLHSMMSVFTFMGASILRQDDSYSFQVITRILETVFPALVMACSEHKTHSVVDMVTMVLRVFIDTYPHIPEHRKLMVFTTLLRVIGVESYMWRFLLVFIEGVATRSKTGLPGPVGSEASSDQTDKSKAIDQVHVDFLISLVLEFSPLNCVQMAHHALKYLSTLPDEKKADVKQKVRQQSVSVLEASKEECEIFSLAYHNAKQLHKFKHATMVTLQQLVSSRNFVAKISEQLDGEMMKAFRQLLETVLTYMAHTSQAVERFAASPHVAYWKGLLTKCSLLLDSLVSLLPQDHFLNVVCELLDSSLTTVQRKAMELLSLRLKQIKDTGITQGQKMVLLEVVPKLQRLVRQLQTGETQDVEEMGVSGRMALYTLMLLARVLGMEYHVTFSQVLKQVCEVMKDEGVSTEAATSAMMCAAEIVSNIQAYAIVHLPLLMPFILQQLENTHGFENELLPCSVISLHKIMDALPHFLTPYIQGILSQVCHLQTVVNDAPSSEQKEQLVKSLKHTCKSVAALPSRVFLPTLDTCYASLLSSGRQESVTGLLNVLGQHVSSMSREELHRNHQQLVDFFLVALDLRVTQRKELRLEVIDKIEGAVIDAILAMVLKMTEGTLRPMLLRMFDWATQGTKRPRIITFYRLADSLAGKLQGLFVIFAGNIIKYAAQILDSLNGNKADEPFLKKDSKGKKSSQLLKHVLGLVQKVCLFDTKNFTKEWFTLLMDPLLDQVENFVGGKALYEERIQEFLAPAVANFAAATKNDGMWKTLNFHMMQKARSKNKDVRLSALHLLRGLLRKLGEDYRNLMPETMPFLLELMEDDNEEVENLSHDIVKEIGEVTGEPLDKYLN